MKTYIWKIFRYVPPVLVILVFAGCASIDHAYIPQKVGPIPQPATFDGVEVIIQPHQDAIQIGQPIYFEIALRNAGNRTIQIPKDPHVILTWVYPNGVRDNFVHEPPEKVYLRKKQLVTLAPGEIHTVTKAVKTYYFSRTGITEFIAIVSVPNNLNQKLDFVWEGKAISNGYGVLVESQNTSSNPILAYSRNQL